jgi:hypothetical protein
MSKEDSLLISFAFIQSHLIPEDHESTQHPSHQLVLHTDNNSNAHGHPPDLSQARERLELLNVRHLDVLHDARPPEAGYCAVDKGNGEDRRFIDGMEGGVVGEEGVDEEADTDAAACRRRKGESAKRRSSIYGGGLWNEEENEE